MRDSLAIQYPNCFCVRQRHEIQIAVLLKSSEKLGTLLLFGLSYHFQLVWAAQLDHSDFYLSSSGRIFLWTVIRSADIVPSKVLYGKKRRRCLGPELWFGRS